MSALLAMDLPTARLGLTDLWVSRLGLGCASIASLTTRQSASDIETMLSAAAANGIRFFDTADVYGQGDSERLLGQAFASRSVRPVICTKVGMRLAAGHGAIRWAKPLLQPLLRRWPAGRAAADRARSASERQCFEPPYVRHQVEASLRRLRSAQLDLLLLHSPPVEVAARDELLWLLHRLQREGKVRWFGVSAAQAAHAPLWAKWPGVSCLQLPLTPGVDPRSGELALGAAESATVAELRARGIGVIAREVLGGGRLAQPPRVRAAALAAVLSCPGVTVALVGTGNASHLQQALQDCRPALCSA